MSGTKIKVGDIAPDFKLLDQDGEKHSLFNYRGDWILIYFYPRDDTPGCTKEACAIRDSFPNFKKLRLKILGVSPDSTASHKKFADKYDLPFTILADMDKKVAKTYGVWGKKKFMGREYMGILRTSFLVDPKGKIVKIYEKVKPEIHAEEVLADKQVFNKNKKINDYEIFYHRYCCSRNFGRRVLSVWGQIGGKAGHRHGRIQK